MRLAIFDLDGTISRHDTLAPYALGLAIRTRPWRLPLLLLMLPVLLGYAIGLIGRGGLKAAFIVILLSGCRRKTLAGWNVRFVDHLVAHGLFPQAVAAIQGHVRAGDHLVLLSASTDLYVPAIGRALGFQEVICTGVRWGSDRLLGTLATPNRRGREKARCVVALRARHPDIEAVAYGNAASDLEHLKLVERGVLINGSRFAQREAVRAGIAVTAWH